MTATPGACGGPEPLVEDEGEILLGVLRSVAHMEEVGVLVVDWEASSTRGGDT